MPVRTDLQQQILVALRRESPLTAREIATRIGSTARAVATALTWLRGDGWVTDGSTARRVGGGISHSATESPIRWSYLRTREQAPLNRVFQGQRVEPLA